jgi:hypothetical protein
MSERHATSNIRIASLDRDRKEIFRRSLFSLPPVHSTTRDAVPDLISAKRSAAPLKKRQAHITTSIEDNDHASPPLVAYHEEPPSNESWSPIPFEASPGGGEMIMPDVMEDYKRMMLDGVILEAKELPNLDSPRDIDVLCLKGGGKKAVAHPGNKDYSKQIKEAVEHSCDKRDKGLDIFDLVSEIQESTFS